MAKPPKLIGTAVDQLSAQAGSDTAAHSAAAVESRPAPQPAPAGSAGLFTELKKFRGMLPDDVAPAATVLDPDQFAMTRDSPMQREHKLLCALFEAVVETVAYHQADLHDRDAGRALLAPPPVELTRVILAAAERHINALLTPTGDLMQTGVWQSRSTAAATVTPLLQSHFEAPRDLLFDLLLYLSARPTHVQAAIGNAIEQAIFQAESEASLSPLTEGERYVLWLFRASLISGPPLGTPSEHVERLSRLIDDGANFYLLPGEAWSEMVNTDLTRLDPPQQTSWSALLRHALSATAARPSTKWLAASRKLVDSLGAENVHQALLRWLPLVTKGQSIRKLGSYPGDTRGGSDVMNEDNATCLRGLLWLVQTLPRHGELLRLITSVALSAYKKVPGVGPRAVKVGNAAVYALSEMSSIDAVGQLAMLSVRVRFGTAQKEIAKAFTAAAEALGLPRDQIEEMGVPSYGLEEVGLRRQSFDGYRAELIVTGSDAELKWFDANDKSLKAVPAKVKTDRKDEWSELQQAMKDIQAMLPAQRDRVDSMFLLQKTWPLEPWRERYLDHPLVGTIARRLIWCVDGTAALFVDGRPTDVQAVPIAHQEAAEITLWHPVGRSINEITAWRRRLEELGITQPFKQAHRELYLLTDAERRTGTYSNRFAAHIIRQHQFNALCAARGAGTTSCG